MTQPRSELDQLMTPEEVAAALGCAVQTLAAWRSTRRSDLPYVKINARVVRYRRVDVKKFLLRRLVLPTPCKAVTA